MRVHNDENNLTIYEKETIAPNLKRFNITEDLILTVTLPPTNQIELFKQLIES